jgi:hypothetical protein
MTAAAGVTFHVLWCLLVQGWLFILRIQSGTAALKKFEEGCLPALWLRF